MVPKFVLELPGHDWEPILVDAFPALGNRSNNGKLVLDVLNDALIEHADWIPTDFRALFDALLARAGTNPE